MISDEDLRDAEIEFERWAYELGERVANRIALPEIGSGWVVDVALPYLMETDPLFRLELEIVIARNRGAAK